MYNEEILINKIENNDVADILLSGFRSSLVQRIEAEGRLTLKKINKISTLALSAVAYRNYYEHFDDLKNTEERPIFVGERSEDLDAWNHILDEVKTRDGVLYCPDKNEIEKANASIQSLMKACSEARKNVTSMITHICFFKSTVWKSGSHPHFFGCIFLNIDQTIDNLSLAIVHEMAHQELFLLNLVDRLVLSSSDYNLIHAPFQNMQRPPIGRLHSAHALFRMGQFRKKVKSCSNNFDSILKETVQTFDSKEELTPFARKIIDKVYIPYLEESY